MDVLGDAVTALRAGRPVATAMGFAAPWGQRFASVPGAVGLQIVVRGECWLMPGGEPVRLTAGDVVLLTDGRGHALADDPATPLRSCEPGPRDGAGRGGAAGLARPTVVVCAAYELGDFGRHPLLRALPERAHLRAAPALRTVAGLLRDELERGADPAGLGVTALVDLLFLHTLRTWYAGRGEPGALGAQGVLGDLAVRAALEAMHAAPERPWTVAALAARGGLSRAPFARRFARLTGRPPLAYLTWWRLTVAARLLRESDAPLRTIARQVGYASEFALAAAFKRAFGVPPGQYRAGRAPSG